MQKSVYQVNVPPVLEAFTEFKTARFREGTTAENRENALAYLTQVVQKCVQQDRICIYDLEDQKVDLEAEKYMTRGMLNLPNVLQCRIVYTYDNAIKKYFVHSNPFYRIGEEDFGKISIGIAKESEHPHIIFEFSNSEKWKNREKGAFLRNNLENDFEPLYPENLYDDLQSIKHYAEIFKNENQYSKLVLKDTKFRKFEANFLSLMNGRNPFFYLFVPSKLMRITMDILTILRSMHGFEYKESEKTALKIDGQKYFAWTFEKSDEKIYTTSGKIFLRNQSGMFRCDKETTFEDIVNFPISKELDDLMKII